MKTFFADILTEGNPKSSRRLVTLLCAFLFILTCASIPFLLGALFLYTNKLQGLNTVALAQIVDLTKTVLEYEFLIIAVGLFVTAAGSRLQLFTSFFSRAQSPTTVSASDQPQAGEEPNTPE